MNIKFVKKLKFIFITHLCDDVSLLDVIRPAIIGKNSAKQEHWTQVIPEKLGSIIQVRIDLELNTLQQTLVLGHPDHHINMVVLASLHQLGGDVWQEVTVNDTWERCNSNLRNYLKCKINFTSICCSCLQNFDKIIQRYLPSDFISLILFQDA